MNDAKRIIALDEKLDQVIRLRGENIEFRAEEEDHKNVGGVLGAVRETVGRGTGVLAGLGAGAVAYQNRDKISKYAQGAKNRYNATRRVGGGVASGAANAVVPGSAQKIKKKASEIKGKVNPYVKGQARRTGRMLKNLRKKIFKYEEPSVEDLMEFMYASDGKGYGDIARKQQKDAKNTTSARTKRKAKANMQLAKKKILAILARRKG